MTCPVAIVGPRLRLPGLSWSPDGKGVTSLQDSTIVEQPLAGGSPRVIARLDGQPSVMGVSMSPDGSCLAFTRGWYPNDMAIIKGLRRVRPTALLVMPPAVLGSSKGTTRRARSAAAYRARRWLKQNRP